VESAADPDKPVVMLDDDLGFFRRKRPEAYNLMPISGTVLLDQLFRELNDIVAVEGYAYAGLCPRQGNNRYFPHTRVESMRINAVHCLNPRKLAEYNARYDAVDLMEDYHVVLTLLEAGQNNCVITDGAWDQVRGSGAPGGMSHYRTKELQAAASFKLAELHPGYVRVVEKEPKTGQGDQWGGVRTDVRVYWYRAFTQQPLGEYEPPQPRGPYRPDHSYRKDRETRKPIEEDVSEAEDDGLQPEAEPATVAAEA
jgi:hypothetical protein